MFCNERIRSASLSCPPGSSKIPTCSGCQFTFPKLSMLADHISINNEDFLHLNAFYDCNICGNENMDYDNAVIHFSEGHLIDLLEEDVIPDPPIIFNDKKEFPSKECAYCGKCFRRPADLERHLRVHTGERPFKCDDCEETFKVKSHLNAHIATHQPSIQSTYRCNICKKVYLSDSALKIHFRIHTNYNPFPCDYPGCFQSFRTRKLMQSHYRRDHDTMIKKRITKSANGQLFGLVKNSNSTITPRAIVPDIVAPVVPVIQPTPLLLSKNSAFTPIQKVPVVVPQPIVVQSEKPPILTGQVVVRVQLRSVSVGPEHSNLRSQAEIVLYVDSLRTHAAKSSILSTVFRLGGCPMTLHMLVDPKATLERLRETPETGFLMAVTPAIGDPSDTRVDGPLYFVITPQEATWGVLPSLFIECFVMQPEATVGNRQQFAQSCLPLLNDYDTDYPRFI